MDSQVIHHRHAACGVPWWDVWYEEELQYKLMKKRSNNFFNARSRMPSKLHGTLPPIKISKLKPSDSSTNFDPIRPADRRVSHSSPEPPNAQKSYA